MTTSRPLQTKINYQAFARRAIIDQSRKCLKTKDNPLKWTGKREPSRAPSTTPGLLYSLLLVTLATATSVILQRWLGHHPVSESEIIEVRHFGVKGDGLADDTLPLRAAIRAAAGRAIRLPRGTFALSGPLVLPSNTTITGEGDATVLKLRNGNLSGIEILNATHCTVRDLQITGASGGESAYIGAIHLSNSTHCEITNVTIHGMTWAGIYINNSSYNTISHCRFSGWRGVTSDSADIMIYNNSNHNSVINNQCHGGGYFGIAVMDPYRKSTPTGNRIAGNTVGEHQAYGILAYVTGNYNSQTLIRDNTVSDIAGTVLGGASGTGIYVQSAAGTIVSGNRVKNCCTRTTNFGTLAPAGIGITSPTTESAPIVVSDNVVDETVRGPGIAIMTAGPGVIVQSNTVVVANEKAGTNGHGIIISNASQIIVANNQIDQKSHLYSGINCAAFDPSTQGITLEANIVRSIGPGVSFNPVNAGAFLHNRIHANFVQAEECALFLNSCSDALIIGNTLISTRGRSLAINNCPFTRLSTTTLISSDAAQGPAFTKNNRGSLMDRSCHWTGTMYSERENGILIEQMSTDGPPRKGNWNVGDTMLDYSSKKGAPKKWVCVESGAPGEWVPSTLF